MDGYVHGGNRLEKKSRSGCGIHKKRKGDLKKA